MISEGILLKQLAILLISSVKFLIAAPASYLLGYSYVHTMLNTTAGGLMGVLFFFFLSRTVLKLYKLYAAVLLAFVLSKSAAVRRFVHNKRIKPAHRKIFTRRNRTIVKIRKSFGFPGIIILTPVLFSIPLGTFLAMKYYSRRRNLLAWLSLSVVVWAVVLSTVIKVL